MSLIPARGLGLRPWTIRRTTSTAPAGRGIRVTDGVVVVNTDVTNKPANNINNQRTAQFRVNGQVWESIAKSQIAPLQIHNSTLIFTVSENGSNNALVLSYAVGDGAGAAKIIHDPALTSTGDRLFIGGGATFRNVDIHDFTKTVLNDLPHDLGVQEFSRVRIIGPNEQIDQQGLTVYEGTRLIGNTRTSDQIVGFFGSGVARRYSACFINCHPWLDGGHGSSNDDFPLLKKFNSTGIRGAYRVFLSRWALRVTDSGGDGIEGVKVHGIIRRSGGALIVETALDFSARFRAYAYDSARYGVVSDDGFSDAGEDIETRLDGHTSLDGADELVTNSDGRPVVSGETVVTNPELRLAETQSNTTTTSMDRTNLEDHELRLTQYGYIPQQFEPPLDADPDDDGSDVPLNRTMITDARIVSTKAEADDLTSVANLQELYDRIRQQEYLKADDLHFEPISFDGKRIVFPANSTIIASSVSTHVVYDDDGISYRVRKSGSAVAKTDDLDTLDLGSTGSAASGIFAVNIPIISAAGVTLLIKTAPVSALLRIFEYESDGTTLTETHTGTSGSDGVYTVQVAADAKIVIDSKKHGYRFDTVEHDMEDGLEVDVSMSRIVHIDTTRDLSDYGTTGIEDSLAFVYDTTDNKGDWVCGEINLTNKFILTAALLDDRISSQAGLQFYAWFRTQAGVADHLNGQPFAWSHDRLEINEDHMRFLRVAAMTGVQISRLGVNVKRKDGETNYDAPESNNSLVQFDNLAILVPLSTLADVSVETRDQIERAGGLLALAKAILDKFNFNSDDDVKATLDGEEVGVLSATQQSIAAWVWNRAVSSIVTVGSIGRLLKRFSFNSNDDVEATLDGETVSLGTAPLTSDETRDAVWEATTAGRDTDDTMGKHVADLTSGGGGGGGGLTDDQEGKIDGIKAKTDSLNFTGDDVKATLDGEQVTTNAASRNASKATIPTSDITAIKAKTDSLNFTGDDVKATLDGEEVTTDSDSRTASMADVSGVASQSSVDAIPTAAAPTVSEIRGDIERSDGLLQQAKTAIDAVPTDTAAPADIPASDITAIKAKTDSLNFTGDDVKATLDGEEVAISGGQASVDNDAIAAAVWDALKSGLTTTGSIGEALARIGFTSSDDVKATLDGELVRVPHRVYVIWDGASRIVWWDEGAHHLERFDFDLPAGWTDIVGLACGPDRIYVAVQPSGEACTVRSLRFDGSRVPTEDMLLPAALAVEDISVDAGTMYALADGHVYARTISTNTAAGSVSVDIPSPRAMDTWDGHHYLVSQAQQQVRAFEAADGSEDTSRRVALHTSGAAPLNTQSYGIAVDGPAVRILDRGTGIFSYPHSGTEPTPEEHVSFQTSGYRYMTGVPFARSADILAAIEADSVEVTGTLTTAQAAALGRIDDNAAEAAKYSRAHVEFEDEEAIIKDGDTELKRLDRKQAIPSTDWRGGFEEPEP